jgi:hypothetical protein
MSSKREDGFKTRGVKQWLSSSFFFKVRSHFKYDFFCSIYPLCDASEEKGQGGLTFTYRLLAILVASQASFLVWWNYARPSPPCNW